MSQHQLSTSTKRYSRLSTVQNLSNAKTECMHNSVNVWTKSGINTSTHLLRPPPPSLSMWSCYLKISTYIRWLIFWIASKTVMQITNQLIRLLPHQNFNLSRFHGRIRNISKHRNFSPKDRENLLLINWFEETEFNTSLNAGTTARTTIHLRHCVHFSKRKSETCVKYNISCSGQIASHCE